METDNSSTPAADDSDTVGEVSRRKVLAGAGALAVGAMLAGTAPAVPAREPHHGLVGGGPTGASGGEFVARILQSGPKGEAFTSFGYLVKLAEVAAGNLFAGQPHNVSTALMTTYTEGTLRERIIEGKMRVLDVMGTLTIYQRKGPGASFDKPESFKEGTQVAQFALTLQDVLAIFAPHRGIPTLSGEMHQTASAHIASLGKRFGRIGMNAHLSASGIGELTDPATLNATLEMAGNWTIA